MCWFEPIAWLIGRDGVFVVTTYVCMFGAPWKKPTSIASNFIQILILRRSCSGLHDHISLPGNPPCGRSWTVVAAPYWPGFARQWVRACRCLVVLSGARQPPLHLAGFDVLSPELTIEQVLNDMMYKQPQGRESSTIAVRLGAGVQPTGRAMPQLLPDGLGPDDHVKVALATVHPLARPPTVPGYCQVALNAQRMGIRAINKLRSIIMVLLCRLAAICMEQNLRIASLRHAWIRPTVEQRNVAFMREVTFTCLGLDIHLMVDFVSGLPMMGWARHSPVMQQRESMHPRARRPSPEEVLAENRVAIKRAKPSNNPKLDDVAWEKTKAGFAQQTMKGPYCGLDELPKVWPDSCAVPRWLNCVGILEMRGGATLESCRVIDDGKARRHSNSQTCGFGLSGSFG